MKKWISFLLCTVLLLSIGAGFSGCKKQEVLKLGIDPYFVPMTYEDDENGTYSGYIIDIMEEAANRMGMKLEVQKCIWVDWYWFMGQGENNCIWNAYD